MLNLSQISLWGPIIPVTCILPSVSDQIYTRGARVMRARTAGSEGGWRSSRVWRRRADSWAPWSGARCGSRALPPSCRGCQGEPLREAVFLQALPKTIEKKTANIWKRSNMRICFFLIKLSLHPCMRFCETAVPPQSRPLEEQLNTRWFTQHSHTEKHGGSATCFSF